jgi:hypothetical protein
VCTLSFACAATLAGCARPARAENTSVRLAQRVSKGKCTDTSGLPASAEANWTAFCDDLGGYLPSEFKTPFFVTESRQTGEIGWRYTSSAVFTNKEGSPQTITFEYAGDGYLANKPSLIGASSSINAELVGQSVDVIGGWTDAVPGPEEAGLVEDVTRLLSERQCAQLEARSLQPLKGSVDTSFADACTTLDSVFKKSYSLEMTGYETNKYYNSDTPITSDAPQSTNQVSTASFPEFNVQLIQVKGKWYLNRVFFEKKLFRYTL